MKEGTQNQLQPGRKSFTAEPSEHICLVFLQTKHNQK